MKQAIIKIIIFFNFVFNQAFSQKLIYSDIFNGTVECYYIELANTSIEELTFKISTNKDLNTIRRALLVYNHYNFETKIENNSLFTEEQPRELEINNYKLELNIEQTVSEYKLGFESQFLKGYKSTRLVDITSFVSNFIYNFEIIFLAEKEEYPDDIDQNLRYRGFSLLLLFDDNSKDKISINVFANNTVVSGNIEQNYINLNPIKLNKNVGYSLMMLEAMSYIDRSLIFIDNNHIGDVWGNYECDNYALGEVFGNFIYENGILLGICEDSSNTTMNEADALANIQQFLSTNTSFRINSIFNDDGILLNKLTNPLTHSYVVYTPNCDVFETQTSRDTVICLGESAPIFASGGQSYEWEPQIGLSCYDCPNPVFNHDSTITYTVRIWNNDSCSKVLPVRVRVHKPQAPQISTTPSLCADSTGSVTFSGLSEFNAPYTYQLLGVSNASGSFANVLPGEHTYSITDKYGCVYEGTAIVGVIPPKAQFTANPEQGQEPLTVTFNNSSQNSNAYIWIIGTDTFYTQSHTHTFDTAGQYQVLLVAYKNNPECADTAMFTVNVFAQFYVLIPNIFTPNSDGVNDEFTFEASRIREAEWEIFNRWGSTLHKGDWKTEQAFFNDTHIIPVWNGITQRNEPALDGVYFYKITVKTLNNVFETFTGYVTIVR